MFIEIDRLPIMLYLVDAFHFAASATAAGSVSLQVMTFTFLFLTFAQMFRSLFGFAFPLFGQQMFKALGLGPGNSVCYLLFRSGLSWSLGLFSWKVAHEVLTASRGPSNCAGDSVPYMDILQGRDYSHEK